MFTFRFSIVLKIGSLKQTQGDNKLKLISDWREAKNLLTLKYKKDSTLLRSTSKLNIALLDIRLNYYD